MSHCAEAILCWQEATSSSKERLLLIGGSNAALMPCAGILFGESHGCVIAMGVVASRALRLRLYDRIETSAEAAPAHALRARQPEHRIRYHTLRQHAHGGPRGCLAIVACAV